MVQAPQVFGITWLSSGQLNAVNVCADSYAVKPLYSDHLWAIKSGLYREVVSVQRSKSLAKELLGPNQVVSIERWSLYRGQNQ